MNSTILRKIYNLTCEGQQFISKRPPDVLPKINYSLVEVSYTPDIIISVKGIYIGKDSSERSECIFNDVDINSLSPDGYTDSYLQLVWEFIDTFEDTEMILDNTNIIDLKSDPIPLILEQLFIIGLGSTLVYFHFMTETQEKIGHPFYPMKIDFPTTVSIKSIDQNIINQLTYPARLLFNIAVKNHGKLWMAQIMDFATTWEPLIPKRFVLADQNEDIVYNSILGYSDYLYSETGFIYDYFKKAENVIVNGSDHIEAITINSLERIHQKDMEVYKKLRYASLLITTITTLVLKTIKADTDISIQELVECKDVCKKDLETIFEDISTVKTKTITHLDSVATTIDQRLHDLAEKYMEEIEAKTKNVDTVIEELQRQLKIYATRNIQELQLTKRDIVKFMYDQIPGISEKVKDEVDGIINKNITKRIDDRFNDVLDQYQDEVEDRISEMLDPIVKHKVRKFTQETEKASKNINSQAERARKYANLTERMARKVDTVCAQAKEYSDGSVQSREIKQLQKDVEELKKSIRDIMKSTGIEL